MSNGIDGYLEQLRREMAGCDPATVQDAAADAEEYLRDGIDQILASQPQLEESDALERVMGEYGSPAEVAAAYKAIEKHLAPPFAPSDKPNGRSAAARFFGAFIDPRAYGALFYMFFSLATGIFYFTWVVSGVSISLSFLILIIGIPVLALFMLSIRGLSLVEGRIVEGLLGVRMPRRPPSSEKHLKLWTRFVRLFTDRRIWFTMVYMIVQLPLGIFYFTLFVTAIAFGLAGIASPVWQYGFGEPTVNIGNNSYFVPGWLMPVVVAVGVLWLLLTLHLAKLFGRLHGAFAKRMLVRF
ncbi:MAG: sensor domain-containing protein [Candidatus Latescibacterota bacterium]|nr:MAG: sensor domain-containing protein [Candidatus Latescibacterota bacterium]